MTLRTIYSNKEIEVLESYSHRLNNKAHISFPGGTFGDMLWVSMFVSTALHYTKDVYYMCPVTPEGRVETPSYIKDTTNSAFKLPNDINEHIETRHDILFAVYMATNESSLTDIIHKVDDGNDEITLVDIMISHCCDNENSDLMSMFETEFNQKLIFIMPTISDAEFYGQICSSKTDIDKECDWFFTPNIKYIKNNITDNTLVINPNRLVIDEEGYVECVKEILDFIGMEVDTDGINKMVAYRTMWYNTQPKYILEYDFKI